MAFLEVKNVRIAGLSASVPKDIVKNEGDAVQSADYDAAAFVETTGVAQRRVSNTLTASDLAFFAAREDGIIPAVLNASDEVAVKYFLGDKIGFTDIFEIVEKTVKGYSNIKNPTLDDIINADKEARIITTEHINKVI